MQLDSDGHPRLPWELFDDILDELGSNVTDPPSRNTLRSCALVCRRFHFISSGHIFSELMVNEGTTRPQEVLTRTGKRLQDLHHILLTNNNIAPRVQSFTIETSFRRSTLNLESDSEPKDSTNIILSNEHLPIIIASFSSLRHFGWVNKQIPLFWTSISSDIRIAIEDTVKRPSLRSLVLECIYSLNPMMIAHCNNLQYLRLVHVKLTYRRVSSQIMAPLDTLTQMRSLTNFNSMDILFIQDSCLRQFASRLRDLHVWMRSEQDVHANWHLMQAVSRTLELLDIPEMSHLRYPTLIPGPIDLGVLENLRIIKMGCRIAALDNVIFPPTVSGLLRTPKTRMKITNIYISIDWIDCRVGSEEARFDQEPEWGVLDETLSQRDVFAELKTVELTLRLGYGWNDLLGGIPPPRAMQILDKVKKLAGGLLSRTSESGEVKVNVQVFMYKSSYVSNLSFI